MLDIAGKYLFRGVTMNRISKFIAISAFSLIVLALPSIASAQYGGYGNGGYGNQNGRYNRDIRGTLQSLYPAKLRLFPNP